MQKCKGERYIVSGDRWRPQVAGGGKHSHTASKGSKVDSGRTRRRCAPTLPPATRGCHLPPEVDEWITESMAGSMTDFPLPEPEPDHPHLGPDGRDLRPENGHPSQSSGFRSPFARWYSALGRAAIAMAAVRRGACGEPGRVSDPSGIRPPTDATQSRPYPGTQVPIWFPVSP